MNELQQYDLFLSVLGSLSRLVVLSMMLERGLAVIFEHEWYRRAFTKQLPNPSPLALSTGPSPPAAGELVAAKGADVAFVVGDSKLPGMRGSLALAAAIFLCWYYQFDVLAVLFNKALPDLIGEVVTGFVVAGGSAGAIALFQGFLGFNRETREALVAAKQKSAETAKELATLDTQAKEITAKARLELAKLAAETEKVAAQAALDRDKRAAEAKTAAVVLPAASTETEPPGKDASRVSSIAAK